MIKISTNFDSKKVSDKIINAINKKIANDPSIIEKKLNEKAEQLALTYQDETGLKPEVIIKVVDVQCGSTDMNLATHLNISVLNGDDEYKARVTEFIKSNLKG